ncbi:MAG: hypothetical protein ACRETY_04550 [Steroidobacteraceae bacterium]
MLARYRGCLRWRPHRLVHEGKVVVQTLDDGAFRFVKPNGRSFDSPPPIATHWESLVATNEEDGIPITPKTALANWTGGGFDLGLGAKCCCSNMLAARRKTFPRKRRLRKREIIRDRISLQ